MIKQLGIMSLCSQGLHFHPQGVARVARHKFGLNLKPTVKALLSPPGGAYSTLDIFRGRGFDREGAYQRGELIHNIESQGCIR